jgi:hypothetical protein
MGIDRFLTRELEASIAVRAKRWKLDFSSQENYLRSVGPNRQHFLHRIGAVDSRFKPIQMELVATTSMSALVGLSTKFSATAVRWTVLDGVQAEGLLLKPKGQAKARVVAVGDASQSPESLAGLLSGLPVEAQFARRLAENNCEVLIPVLIDRADAWSGNPKIRMTNQPHREYIYRMAFEMGRHIIGYEVQKVLSAIDWFKQSNSNDAKIGVAGYSEGGLIALYAAAVDKSNLRQIQRDGGDFAFEGDLNIVEVYIGRLRRKVDKPFGRADLETLRGIGYRLRLPDDAS